MDKLVFQICEEIKKYGGKAYLVGGCVRDSLLGIKSKDIDIEVYHLDKDVLALLLSKIGNVKFCGESFGVFKLNNEIDISIPRREIKTGEGHKGFDISLDPFMSLEEAVLRRDFTINSIMYDPLEQKFIDFHGGIEDFQNGILRVVSYRFAEDPLRVLRGMQFAGRFDLQAEDETLQICQSLKSSYKELAKERVYQEFYKWAEKSDRPSSGLVFLRDCGWLEHFPELMSDNWKEADRCDKMKSTPNSDPIDIFFSLLYPLDHNGVIQFFNKHFAGYSLGFLAELVRMVDISKINLNNWDVRYIYHKQLKGFSLDRLDRMVMSKEWPQIDEVRMVRNLKKYKPIELLAGADLIDMGFSEGVDLGKALNAFRNIQIYSGIEKKDLLDIIHN